MFEPRTLIQKHHEERTSYLRKFASFMNKRVLTPTFGDNIEKKKRDLNESYNQENDFDICDLNLFKKEKTIVTSTKHPIISRKSPLFDKFGKRNSHETSVEKKIIEIHDNNDEKNLNKNKNNEVLFNKNRIIFRKRDSSAKKPKEEVFPVASRLFTPQSKKTKNNLSPLNGNFIFERLQMNKKIDINKNKLLNNSKELLNSVNENYISTKKENFKSLEDIIENLKNVMNIFLKNNKIKSGF